MRRHKGFTVAELLVVLLIVGVLTMMVVPVFLQARRQARAASCVTNVRSIAIAIRLYGSDYGAFFPDLTDRSAADWWNAFGMRNGCLSPSFTWPEVCDHARQADPYLRPQVILSSYLRNRQVWQCPQARLKAQPAAIVPMGRDGYWINNFIDHPNFQTDRLCEPCMTCWPTGWGGAITDSFVQGMHEYPAYDPAAFTMSIATNSQLSSISPAEVADPSRYIAVGDSGSEVELWSLQSLAYPEVRACGIDVGSDGAGPEGICGTDPGCCISADPANCPWSATCGLTYAQKLRWYTDARLRASKTRHLGGVNVGFLDGHVQWVRSETLIRSVPPFRAAWFDGLCSCWPGNGVV